VARAWFLFGNRILFGRGKLLVNRADDLRDARDDLVSENSILRARAVILYGRNRGAGIIVLA
jgi:hypothetical protein